VEMKTRPGVPVLKSPRTLVRIESPRIRVTTLVPEPSRLKTMRPTAMVAVGDERVVVGVSWSGLVMLG